jgi:hydroxyacylglutathione hydrolase
MSNYKIDIIPALSDNYIFILRCLDTSITACIDPATSIDVINYLEEHNLNLDFILNTHHHYDHIGGNEALKSKYNCKIIGFVGDKHRIQSLDQYVDNSDIINIGSISLKIITIPGHTDGHIGYYDEENQYIFLGDTIFGAGCGRVFEGKPERLFVTINKIRELPDETKLFFAHEYTLNNIEFALLYNPSNQQLLNRRKQTIELRNNSYPSTPSTIALEKLTNPFFRTIDPEIRKSLSKTNDEYSVNIFKALRKLKDLF